MLKSTTIVFDLNNGNVTEETAGSREGTRNSPLPTTGDESPGQAVVASRTPPREEPQRSQSRSDHRRRSPTDPKQGGPFKVTPFDPKEMRTEE